MRLLQLGGHERSFWHDCKALERAGIYHRPLGTLSLLLKESSITPAVPLFRNLALKIQNQAD